MTQRLQHPGRRIGHRHDHIAGFVNLAMMAMAAAAFYSSGNQRVAELETATRPSRPAGPGSRHPVRPLPWSPPASPPTVVGTLAGQVVMQGLRALHHSRSGCAEPSPWLPPSW